MSRNRIAIACAIGAVLPNAVFASGNFGSLVVEMFSSFAVTGVILGAISGTMYPSVENNTRRIFWVVVFAVSFAALVFTFVHFGANLKSLWDARFEFFPWAMVFCFVLSELLAFFLCQQVLAKLRENSNR
jgi:hypothetical protein